MIQTVPLNCCVNTFLVEQNGLKSSASRKASSVSTICCSVSRKKIYIPRLESFGKNKIDRFLKEAPLIERTENEIAEYCLTLEGDECYNCWQAYFKLEELEKEAPKEDIERLIRRADGVESLVSSIPRIAPMYKAMKAEEPRDSLKQTKTEPKNTEDPPRHIPDGLPKTPEELKEEEEARMPDSPFTRLLRVIGRRSDCSQDGFSSMGASW